jgi:hypothetical protein
MTFWSCMCPYIDELQVTLQKQHEEERSYKELQPKIEVLSRIQNNTHDVCDGEQYFKLALRLLDTFKQKRSVGQKRMHDAIFQTVAPHIYGSDFESNRQKILAMFNRQSFTMGSIIMTPRRFGKTTGVSMAIAVCMYVCRGTNFMVFSTGQEMSTELMQKVKGFFMQLPDAESRVLRSDVKRFVTTYADESKSKSKSSLFQAGRYNCLKARAATVQGNKGITADVFILEEASRIPEQILHEVIAPMMKVSNSSLVALSTHIGKDNYFTKLFENDTNDLLLKVKIELLCQKCRDDAVDPSLCRHLDHLNPHWLSGSDVNKVKLLMGSNDKMFAQEVMGAMWDDNNLVFENSWLQYFKKKQPRYQLTYDPDLFIVSMVDPAGGGCSFTAIVSIVVTPNKEIIIVGLSEQNVTTEIAIGDMMTQYFRTFTQNKLLANIRHVICVENNYGGGLVADVIVKKAQSVVPSILEYRSTTEKPGVVTTNQTKSSAVMGLTWAIYDHKLYLNETIASIHPAQTLAFIEELHIQLARLKKYHTSSGKWSYSGKTKTTTHRDDICIALLLSYYYDMEIKAKSEMEREQRLMNEAL